MLGVREIAPEVFALEEETVRMYLVRGRDRALLIDTGTGSEELEDRLKALYQGQIIVVHTHGHIDHVGNDRLFETVYAHEDAWEEIISNSGIAREKLRPLKHREILDLGDREIETIDSPGHAPGNLNFIDRQNRILFSADNISEWPVYLCMPGADPKAYEAALRQILEHRADYDLILGCHGKTPQTLENAERLLRLLEQWHRGEAEAQPVQIYTGETVKCITGEGVSIYLPA